MANSFNVVTALQTIHEHTHAVGFGCIPSDWTTGDPGADVRYQGAGAGDDAAGIRPYQIAAPHTVYGARLSVRI